MLAFGFIPHLNVLALPTIASALFQFFDWLESQLVYRVCIVKLNLGFTNFVFTNNLDLNIDIYSL